MALIRKILLLFLLGYLLGCHDNIPKDDLDGFSVTYSGTRLDGTVFNESYRYQLISPDEHMDTTGSEVYLTLSRQSDFNSQIRWTLVLDQDQFKQFSGFPSFTSNHKLNSNKVFHLGASLFPEATQVRFPMDPDNIKNDLIFYYQSRYFIDSEDYFDGEGRIKYYGLRNKSNQMVCFAAGTGKFLKVINTDGTEEVTSERYGGLSWRGTFYDSHDNDLSKEGTIGAMDNSITNFTFDRTTGNLKFAFEFTVTKFGNTTGNDLNIKGKFSSKIKR